MNCPPEITEILLQILHRGILATRTYSWGNDAARAALEADHVHNLPSLLLKFSRRNLDFYRDAERTSYISACQKLGGQPTDFEYLWAQLDKAISKLSKS